MLNEIVQNAPLFFLIAVRIISMMMVAPLFSSEGVPWVAKAGLGGFVAFIVYPTVAAHGYIIPDWGLEYAGLAIGEALIGIIVGFFLVIIYSAFSAAGDFFSLQMGFSASEVFDPLAQIEIPLIGQFFNLIAMYVFLATSGFQKLFLIGIKQSFEVLRAQDILLHNNDILTFMLGALAGLFQQSLILSFPILGTLFVVSVSMGLLSRAAPQMNIMTEGFPVAITVAFLLMVAVLPFMMEAFSRVIESAFNQLGVFISNVGSVPTAAPK